LNRDIPVKMKTFMKNHRLLYVIPLIFLLLSCTNKHVGIIDSVVQTKSGKVKGAVNDNGTVVSFKGIPYAAPPVGDLRWREPQPPPVWDGIRDATGFCASCIQNRVYSHLPNGPWTEEFMVQDSISEDCLFLNIWTPAKSASDKLSILVYIHGGAFTEGSGSIDVYDGEELAKKGIIVITINYRLGVLGFLAHPELTAESPNHVSGNYGFLDQMAALRWIRENIAAFGGDPTRVTISGQSAGAASVSALIISPLAKGLFCGAITQSGTSFAGGHMGSRTLGDGERQGVEFAESKGASTIAELRAIPALELIARDPRSQGFRFGGVLDGYFQTGDAKDIFAAGRQNDTPFMTGMNADETQYRGSTGKDFGKLYPSGSKEEKAAAVKLAGQEQGMLNTWLWLEFRAKTAKTKGWEYYFDRAIPWPEHPEFGAFHTGEVPYVFNNLKMLRGHKMEKTDSVVADRMSSYWVNFVRNGDPNGPDLPLWEPYEGNKHEVMKLGEHMGMVPICPDDERCEFLKEQLLRDYEQK
jgi:para-nitrobenzyl esterase